MLKNYLVVTLRTLRRRKGYTAINVVGLALGLACCILIALYVRDELSYDDFHEQVDRLVFVGAEGSFGGETSRGMATPYPLADALEHDVPGVDRAVRVLWPGSGEVSRDGEAFTDEEGVFHADHGFFDLFSFPLVAGDSATALAEPNSAVISEAFAEKYFPDEDPIGQTFESRRYGDYTYRITGIARPPNNSYLDFNALLSLSTLDYGSTHGDSWRASMFLTFALLAKGTPPEEVERQAIALAHEHLGADTKTRFFAEPLSDLYLSDLVTPEGFRGQRRYLYLFGTVAAFILLLAFVNFVNLSTAQSADRAREVGVRKTLGAGRGQLARQFLGESVLLTLSAYGLALLVAQTVLPLFNRMFDKELVLGGSGLFLLVLAGVALGVGLVAGSYPALVLSAFDPTRVLKGSTARRSESTRLRGALVVVQFAVAVVLLVGTAVVLAQLRYTQAVDLGFEKEQVLAVPISRVAEQHEAIKHAFLQSPDVLSVSATDGRPGRFGYRFGFVPDESKPDESMAVFMVRADADYLETLGLSLQAGRFLSDAFSTDDSTAFVFNETTVRMLGWTEPVGHEVPFMKPAGTVVGVVEDFHFASLREKIGPVIIQKRRSDGHDSYSQLLVRFRPGQTAAVVDFLEREWARFSDDPLDPTFLDAEFAAMYRTEQRLGEVFGAFALVAVLIACLGLFGLAAYAAQARTKEIGVRKVLGASVAQIVLLLSKDFARLVLVALAVAVPLAWLAMTRWLDGFAYRVELGPGLFLLAGALAFVVALLTVSYHALRAASLDPVKALRYE